MLLALRGTDLRKSGFDLEAGTCSRREHPHRGHATTRDEERSHVAGINGWNENAHVRPAQALDAAEMANERVERIDAITNACCILEATAVGKIAQLRVEARQRAGRVGELARIATVERAARQTRARPAAKWSKRRRCRRAHE